MLLVQYLSGHTRRWSLGLKATVAAYFSPTAAEASRIAVSVWSGVNGWPGAMPRVAARPRISTVKTRSVRARASTWHRQISQPDSRTYGNCLRASAPVAAWCRCLRPTRIGATDAVISYLAAAGAAWVARVDRYGPRITDMT